VTALSQKGCKLLLTFLRVNLIIKFDENFSLVHINYINVLQGGQILRISVSLSAILCKPVEIKNIRAQRKNPGLAAQHLNGVHLVAELSKGKLEGATLGSTHVKISPSTLKQSQAFFRADTRTAG